MEKGKKVAVAFVYIREIPGLLESTIKNLKMTFSKDGVSADLGHQCPRITVFLETTDEYSDESRAEKLERVLIELEGNNQIAGYSIKYPFKHRR